MLDVLVGVILFPFAIASIVISVLIVVGCVNAIRDTKKKK